MCLMEKDNLTKVKTIIEETTGKDAKVIAVPSELIHFTGKTQKAVFLAQLIYWSDRGSRPDKFIYKTRNQWTEETGLSSAQLASFTEDFKKLGFLQTKLKMADGKPTIHYKLEIDVFLKSFKQFSAKRMSEKLENESQESEDFLTENSSKISSDMLSLGKNSDEFCQDSFTQEKEDSKTEENVKSNVSQGNVSDGINQADSAGNREGKVSVPEDFKPSLDYQYRAVIHFPDKLQSFVTLKFIRNYKSKSMKLTVSEWQERWWEWMISDPPFVGNEQQLEKENNDIQLKVWNEFYGLSYHLKRKLFHRDHFYKAARKKYSVETIEHCLNGLVENKHFASIDNTFFFNLKEYRENPEWKAKVESEAILYDIDLPSIK